MASDVTNKDVDPSDPPQTPRFLRNAVFARHLHNKRAPLNRIDEDIPRLEVRIH